VGVTDSLRPECEEMADGRMIDRYTGEQVEGRDT